jgi:hypothetical protein
MHIKSGRLNRLLLKGGIYSPIILFILVLLFAQCNSTEIASDRVVEFEHFISRKVDKLYDGEDEFRFISFNIPNLHVNEDPLPDGWHRNDPWEIEDAFRTISQLGGQVIRMYVFSIKGGIRNGDDKMSHVYAPGVYDEDLFRDYDYVLKMANKYGIRVIIPFVDNNAFFGGNEQFAQLYNTERSQKTRHDFYHDPEIVQGFKDLVTYVLERENTYTGVKYKDDKAILAWETGNEINPPAAWTAEIAAHIRNIDKNHLIMDGNFYKQKSSLAIPEIDILSAHFYWGHQQMLDTLRAGLELTKGKKAFFLGEFVVRDTTALVELLDSVTQNNVVGACAWSLRFRDIKGGFYYHYEGGPAPQGGLVYRWPGFPNGDVVNERGVFEVMRRKAYEIQGIPPPPLPVPDAPHLFPVSEEGKLGWRGATGSEYFVLEKAKRTRGPWEVVQDELYDDGCPFEPLQLNREEDMGYYRMKAVKGEGVSEPSNIVRFR